MTTEAHERPRSDRPTGRVTFRFSDIEGSTRLRDDELAEAGHALGPEVVGLTGGLAAALA